MTARLETSRTLTTSTAEYNVQFAVPYIDALLANIWQWFSDKDVNILVAMTIFNPSLLPKKDYLASYGQEHIKVVHVHVADYYKKAAEVKHAGVTKDSPAILNGHELLSEWSWAAVSMENAEKSKCTCTRDGYKHVVQEYVHHTKPTRYKYKKCFKEKQWN